MPEKLQNFYARNHSLLTMSSLKSDIPAVGFQNRQYPDLTKISKNSIIANYIYHNKRTVRKKIVTCHLTKQEISAL